MVYEALLATLFARIKHYFEGLEMDKIRDD
jgi:hypothetical protein